MAAPLKKAAARKPAPARRKPYHHGNLREAMIEATVRLVEEEGPERVTVREAARRAGVSSAAPFRHFPSKVALMTAVAEEAMRRLRAEIETAVAHAADDDPLERFRALGAAYLAWVIRNPTHFAVISTRSLIDFDGSEALRRDNAEIQAQMAALLAEAAASGRLRPGDLRHIRLACRALAYGLARMYIDGHLPQWGVAAKAARRNMQGVLDLFLDSLARDGAKSSARRKPRR